MNDNGVWDRDEALSEHSFSPRLAQLLLEVLPKNIPVSDYGCGLGMYVVYLRKNGYLVEGIEGTLNIDKVSLASDIIVHDLTRPLPRGEIGRTTTLCLEVAEHIPSFHKDIFLTNILHNCAGKVVISWAVPGQGGRGHVNERDNLEVVEMFESCYYRLNKIETRLLRDGMKEDKCWWFKNTLFVFGSIAT